MLLLIVFINYNEWTRKMFIWLGTWRVWLLLTELLTAAADKLSVQFGQCSSVNDSCPTDTSGDTAVFNEAWFSIAANQQAVSSER